MTPLLYYMFSVLQQEVVDHQMIHAHVDCGVDPATDSNRTVAGHKQSCLQLTQTLLPQKEVLAALYVRPPPANLMERGESHGLHTIPDLLDRRNC